MTSCTQQIPEEEHPVGEITVGLAAPKSGQRKIRKKTAQKGHWCMKLGVKHAMTMRKKRLRKELMMRKRRDAR